MPSEKPNILFILTDQQRRDSLAAYGNDWIEAPNIDGLARRSIVFDNAYVTQPVCTPSRASIMTGMYPQSTGLIGNGIHLRDDTPTIAEMVSDDYLCAHYGKWHLGNDLIPQHGFEEWRSIEDWHLNAGTTTRKEAPLSRVRLQRVAPYTRCRAAVGAVLRDMVPHGRSVSQTDAGGLSWRRGPRASSANMASLPTETVHSCCSPRSSSRIRPTPGL